MNGLAEADEESPGLVIAKADTAWKTVRIIAGPTGENVGATVTLVPPKDHKKIIVQVGQTQPTEPITINPKVTTSIQVRSANNQTGTERITLRYEVPGKVYLSDTLVVTVVGDEIQIVPEITLVCVGCEKTVWAYRGTTLVDADWFVSFSGSGRIQVKKNNSWITPKGNAKVLGPSQSMTFRGSKASKTATDDVTIEAKEGGETDTEGLYVVSVELTKNWPKNSRILINGQYGVPPRRGMVAIGRPRGLIYHWVYDGGGLFNPNDTTTASRPMFVAPGTPTPTENFQEVHVHYPPGPEGCEDSRILNVVTPTHAQWVPKAGRANPTVVTGWIKSSAPTFMRVHTRYWYNVLCQFNKSVGKLNCSWAYRHVMDREDTPVEGFLAAWATIPGKMSTKPNWGSIKDPNKGQIVDTTKVWNIPVKGLLSQKVGNKWTFDAALKPTPAQPQPIILSVDPHVWHVSVSKQNPKEVTENFLVIKVLQYRDRGGYEELRVEYRYTVKTK